MQAQTNTDTKTTAEKVIEIFTHKENSRDTNLDAAYQVIHDEAAAHMVDGRGFAVYSYKLINAAEEAIEAALEVDPDNSGARLMQAAAIMIEAV